MSDIFLPQSGFVQQALKVGTKKVGYVPLRFTF
jgi:hypothetical protein